MIRKLKIHFARNGIPDCVISDNGPQFASEEFMGFAKLWEFEHRTSSPGHQQANGKAESAVKSAKKLLLKSKNDHTDPYLAILAHRNTPTEATEMSPAQRFLGRRTKTQLPTTAALLKPCQLDTAKVKLQTKHAQARQAYYYNRGAKDLNPLEEGDTVRMRPFSLNKKTWEKAVVTRRLDERSYDVETDTGSYRRNRIDLKETKETANVPVNENVDTPPPEINIPTATQAPVVPNILTEEPPSPPLRRSLRSTREPAYLKDYQH